MRKYQEELYNFLDQNELGHLRHKFPPEFGFNHLLTASRDELTTTYAIKDSLNDLMRALSCYSKVNIQNKNLDLEIEDNPGVIASKITREDVVKQKLSMETQGDYNRLNRRHSVHQACVLQRIVSKKSRTSRNKTCTPIDFLATSMGKTAPIRGAPNLLKMRHLGHSAPDIIQPSRPKHFSSSEHSPHSNSSGDFSRSKFHKYKHGRPSLPSSQPSNLVNKGAESISIAASQKQLNSPKVSSVLQQLQLRNSRRMSMNSFVSSDFSFQLSPSSALSSHDSSQDRLNDSSNNDLPSTTDINTSVDPPFRPRAKSFNSPAESEPDITTLNEFYRECFPKAIEETEERLGRFLQMHSSYNDEPAIKSDGFASFVLQQLLQLAKDCLEKSKQSMLSSSYLAGLVANMQSLLETAQTKEGSPREHLAQLTQDLLVIISRPARLLECLEFDPEDFYRRMEAVEGEGKKISDEDVVGYLLRQLGLQNQVMEDRMVKTRQDKEDQVTNSDSIESQTEKQQSSQASDEANLRSAIKAGKLLSTHPPTSSDFETIKLISNGAYGAVLMVRHVESRKVLAMKKLLKDNLVLRNMVNQVFTERDILTFIDNPFVVSFYCSFETKRHLCIVLEYIEGGDCGALLKNISGPLPSDMAKLYFAETVMALEYLHNFGIVHRDLKPDNLLITSIGHIKLTDFGLSKIGLMKMTTSLYEGSMSESRRFCDCQVFGTPEYIAPEVILKMQYGKPVDWWSMGIILYEFLVGCVPFTGDTPDQVFSEIISGEIEWPEEEEYAVDEDAKTLINGLLIRYPEGRCGSTGANEVKNQSFLNGVDWNGLLRQKTQFVPDLSGEEDTSYFDERSDRYDHVGDEGDEETGIEDSGLFKSFSTCSPRYNRNEDIFTKRKLYENSVDSSLEDAQEKERLAEKNLKEKNKKIKENVNNKDKNKDKNPSKQIPKNSSVPLFDNSFPTSSDQTNDSGSSNSFDHECLRKLSFKNQKVSKSSSFTAFSKSISNQKWSHKIHQQLSQDSSSSSVDETEVGSRVVMIRRGKTGFGFNIRGIRFVNAASNKFRYQHRIVAVEKGSPAWKGGLRLGDMITHVNNLPLCNLNHSQVIKLILKQEKKNKESSLQEISKKVVSLSENKLKKSCHFKSSSRVSTSNKLKEKRNIFRNMNLLDKIDDEKEDRHLGEVDSKDDTDDRLVVWEDAEKVLAKVDSGMISNLRKCDKYQQEHPVKETLKTVTKAEKAKDDRRKEVNEVENVIYREVSKDESSTILGKVTSFGVGCENNSQPLVNQSSSTSNGGSAKSINNYREKKNCKKDINNNHSLVTNHGINTVNTNSLTTNNYYKNYKNTGNKMIDSKDYIINNHSFNSIPNNINNNNNKTLSRGLRGIVKRALKWHSKTEEKNSKWYFDHNISKDNTNKGNINNKNNNHNNNNDINMPENVRIEEDRMKTPTKYDDNFMEEFNRVRKKQLSNNNSNSCSEITNIFSINNYLSEKNALKSEENITLANRIDYIARNKVINKEKEEEDRVGKEDYDCFNAKDRVAEGIVYQRNQSIQTFKSKFPFHNQMNEVLKEDMGDALLKGIRIEVREGSGNSKGPLSDGPMVRADEFASGKETKEEVEKKERKEVVVGDGAYLSVSFTIVPSGLKPKRSLRCGVRKISVVRRKPSDLNKSVRQSFKTPRTCLHISNNPPMASQSQMPSSRQHSPLSISSSFSSKPQLKNSRPSTLSLTRRMSMGCSPVSPLVFSSSSHSRRKGVCQRERIISRNSLLATEEVYDCSAGSSCGGVCSSSSGVSVGCSSINGENVDCSSRGVGSSGLSDGNEGGTEKKSLPPLNDSTKELKYFKEKF